MEERSTLKLKAQLLRHDRENVKALLVDTPGSDEVGQKELQRLAQVNVDAAAAYIYVMQYSNAKVDADYKSLKAIHARSKGYLGA